MHKVKSSNINHIAYNPETKVLEVEFKSGNAYEYHNVTQNAYDNFKAAESYGKYFAKHVKDAYKAVKKPKKDKEDGK